VDVAADVIRWYRDNRRELPWRRTRDPYAVWVSEIMLQQTRVETVVPYWERWMGRFPTVQALAAAPLDDVLAAWAGLGYYSRARNLHAGAREVVTDWGGSVPGRVDALLEIPGIGRYTAGAIASIAFGQPAPLVDGNVARVLARLFAIDEDVKSAAGSARLWALAADLVPAGAAGDFNQGLMELGATVCTPARPRCGDERMRRDRARGRDVAVEEGFGGESRRLGEQQPLGGDARLLVLQLLPEGQAAQGHQRNDREGDHPQDAGPLRHCYFTSRTGTSEMCRTLVAVEPTSALPISLMPRVPM